VTPSIDLIIAVFLLMVCVTAVISLRLKVPYTVTLVILAVTTTIVLSILAFAGPFQGVAQNLIEQIRSAYSQLIAGENGGVFVGLIVPPLLFEAMIHIRLDDLKAVIKPALAMAILGVIIATLVGGLFLWRVIGLSPIISFLFAALIAPTDVVTVMEVFKRVKVPSKLACMLQTESAFNDAPAIFIFTIILSIASLQQVTMMDAVFSFAFTFIVGALIGLGVAFAGEVLSSLFSDSVVETILTVVVVFGSYALATGVGASGLVAVSVAGIYYGSYTMRTAMDQKERDAVTIFWQIVAFIGNTVAFLIIGFQANLLALPQSILLIILAYLAVTIGRAATVYPILHFFKKQIGEKNLKVWSHVSMLGGARGAVSIALASTITVSAVITQNDINIVNTMVFGVAFISIMIQVPMLVRYANKKLSMFDKTIENELHEDFESIETAIIEVNKLKTEGKISQEEFEIKLEALKTELNKIMCDSCASLQTKQIIQERSTALFNSLPKLPIPIQMPHQKHAAKKSKEKQENKEKKENAD
jgi:monovalent cation:H+ antiporter, CPA1 family